MVSGMISIWCPEWEGSAADSSALFRVVEEKCAWWDKADDASEVGRTPSAVRWLLAGLRAEPSLSETKGGPAVYMWVGGREEGEWWCGTSEDGGEDLGRKAVFYDVLWFWIMAVLLNVTQWSSLNYLSAIFGYFERPPPLNLCVPSFMLLIFNLL